MSFIKVKSPLSGKTIDFVEGSKYVPKLSNSRSRKSLGSKDNSLKSPKFNTSDQMSIQSLLGFFSEKKNIVP
jgi:hypothetical protein